MVLLLYVKMYRPTAHQQRSTMLESCVQVLKIDRHKYVKIAYHGFKAMSREDRLNTYSNSDVRLAMHVI
jgi:5' nucleotidase family